MEGLGESFEANLNSGSVRETVKIALPPGTAGLSLALSYDSGQGNGVVGIGWSLGVSTIQVQTEKGLRGRSAGRSASFSTGPRSCPWVGAPTG
jgi:hypothetical protein